jgi:beta-lactam-binding protein with PASTA domain
MAAAGVALLSNATAYAQGWKTNGKYETKPMGSEYSDPQNIRYDNPNNIKKDENSSNAVFYMDDDYRKQFKLNFRTDPDGVRRAYLPHGGRFDTRIKNNATGAIVSMEQAIFVMDAEGSIYVVMDGWIPLPKDKNGKQLRLHHSTIPAGQPVAAAGFLMAEDGIIKHISNNSGHYRPENAHLLQAIKSLEEHAVPKGSYEVDFVWHDPVPGSYLALDPFGREKLRKGDISLAQDATTPDAVRRPRVEAPDGKPTAADDAGLLEPDEPTPIPQLEVSRRAQHHATAPAPPDVAKPVAPPDPSVVQSIRDRIVQTPTDQMDLKFMQEIYQLDPKAAKVVGQVLADPGLAGKNLKMGELRKTMDLQVWKDILKRRGIQVEITNQGKSDGARSDLDYTLYYLAEEAGVSIKDLIAEHTKTWQTLHQLTPDRLEIKVMNGDEFYPDWRTEALSEAEHRAEVKRLLGELRSDPEKYSVPGANKQQVHNRALRDGWTEVLQYDPLVDRPETPIERQIIRDEGLTREIALRYRGVHPQYNHMNALGNLIQNKGEFLHHSGDNAQDAIRRAKYFNRVINEGLGNLRFFANDYQKLFASNLPDREARKLEYLKKTFGLLMDDAGKPLLDDALLRKFRDVIDISMEIELDKTGNRADYAQRRSEYFKDYHPAAEAKIAERTAGQDILPEERAKSVLAEQERSFELDQKRVLAEAVLAGLRHSVVRDLTPEGVLRNRVRFDPATQKFVIDDPEAAKGAKKVAFERATEVALFYELVNSLDDNDPAQRFMKRDMKKRALSTAPSIELAEFYGALDEVGKAEIDRLLARDPEGKVARKIDDLLKKQQARALELLIERKQKAVDRARAKGIAVDPNTVAENQVRDHIVRSRLGSLNPHQRSQFVAAHQTLGTRLSGEFKQAFYQNASGLMLGSSAVNIIRAYQTGGGDALKYTVLSEALNYAPDAIQTPLMIVDLLARIRRGDYRGAAYYGTLWVLIRTLPGLGNVYLAYNITTSVPDILYFHPLRRIDADLVEQALRSRPRNENGGPLRDGVRARANRFPDAQESVYNGSGPGFPLFYGRYKNEHAIAPIVINGEKYSDGTVPHDNLSDEQLADSAALEFAPSIDSVLTAAALEPGSAEWRQRAWDLKLKFGFDIPFYRRMAKVYQEKYKYITYHENYPSRYNPEYLSECRLDVYDWYVRQPAGYKLELKGDTPFRDQSDKMQEMIAQECAVILGIMRELAGHADDVHRANLKAFTGAMARGFDAERALLAAKTAIAERIQAEEAKAARELEQKALALAKKHNTYFAVSYPFTFATEELRPVLEFDMRMLPANVKQPVDIEIDQTITDIKEGAPSGWKPGPDHEDRFRPDRNGWVASRPVTADVKFTAQLLDADKKPVAQSTIDLPVVLYEPSFSGSISVIVEGATATGDRVRYPGALVTIGSDTRTSSEAGSVDFVRLKAGSHAVKVAPRKDDHRHGPASGSATLTDALVSKDFKGDRHASITVLLPYIPEPVAVADTGDKTADNPTGGAGGDKPGGKTGDKAGGAGGGKDPKDGKDDKPDTAAGEPPVVEDLVTVPDVTVIADGAWRAAKLDSADLRATHIAAGNAPSKEMELKVASQDPKAGTRVKRGSTVTISIYQPFVEDSVTVPDVTAIDSAALRVATLARAGLKADHVAAGKAPSPELSLKVADQNPRAGAKAVRDAVVTISVYQPFVKDSATVPSVVGLDSSAVLTALGQAGLAAAFAPAGDAPAKENEFRAASQSEPPGKKLARGSPVTVGMLQAYQEPAVAMATVPELAGMDSASAAAALQRAQLVATFIVPNLERSPNDWFIVAAQSEPAGKQMPPGSPVAVELALVSDDAGGVPDTAVSSPPSPQPTGNGLVPNVVGLTHEQAVAQLEAQGLTVGSIEVGGTPPSPDLAWRTYYQSPPAGAAIPADKMVALKQYGSAAATPPPPTPAPPPAPAGDGYVEYAGEYTGAMPIEHVAMATRPLRVRILQIEGNWVVAVLITTAQGLNAGTGFGPPNGQCTLDGGVFRCVAEVSHPQWVTLTIRVSGNQLEGEMIDRGMDGTGYSQGTLRASRTN